MGVIIKAFLAAIVGFVVVTALMQLKKDAPEATTKAATPPPQKAPAPPAKNADLRLLSWNCSSAYGFATVGGEIKNISNAPIHNLMIVASHYTSDGTFVRSDTGMVEYNPLMPGQTSSFKAISIDNPMMTKCKVGFKRMFGGAVRVED